MAVLFDAQHCMFELCILGDCFESHIKEESMSNIGAETWFLAHYYPGEKMKTKNTEQGSEGLLQLNSLKN